MSEKLLYTTVEKQASDEFEEKKSIFIGAAKPVKSEEEAIAFVAERKKQYSDATHNVWAYSLRGGVSARYSDDGEPQGTGGLPVLETIRKSGVDDVAVVVTRYFGGTLLGAGGLVRAYSKGASIALTAAHIVTYELYDVFRLICSYSDYQRFLAELPKFGAVFDNTDFAADVTLDFAVKHTVSDGVRAKVREMSAGKEDLELTGTRYDYK